MAQNKTQKTALRVSEYLQSIPSEHMRSDCEQLIGMMERCTGDIAHMWGSSIVGVGDYRFVNGSGKLSDWFMLGVSARKSALSLYIGCGLQFVQPMLKSLGAHSAGVGCLYIKKLSDVNLTQLENILQTATEFSRKLAVDYTGDTSDVRAALAHATKTKVRAKEARPKKAPLPKSKETGQTVSGNSHVAKTVGGKSSKDSMSASSPHPSQAAKSVRSVQSAATRATSKTIKASVKANANAKSKSKTKRRA